MVTSKEQSELDRWGQPHKASPFLGVPSAPRPHCGSPACTFLVEWLGVGTGVPGAVTQPVYAEPH